MPKIVSKLKPDQNTADIPYVVSCIFHSWMKYTIGQSKSHFGDFIYIIKVIKFQKQDIL